MERGFANRICLSCVVLTGFYALQEAGGCKPPLHATMPYSLPLSIIPTF